MDVERFSEHRRQGFVNGERLGGIDIQRSQGGLVHVTTGQCTGVAGYNGEGVGGTKVKYTVRLWRK